MGNTLSETKLVQISKDLSTGVRIGEFEYVYRGAFTTKTTSDLLNMVELSLDNSKYPKSLKKKVLFVMVETMQNIMKHQEIDPKIHNVKDNYFSLMFSENHFAITTANIIKSSTKERICGLIDRVNSSPLEQLKKLYQRTLVEGEISDKGGAGLGFIAMARKTDHHLAYQFEELENGYSFFYLKVFVKINPEFSAELKTTEEQKFHKLMRHYNLQSCLRGFFTKSNLELVRIDLETRFANGKLTSTRSKSKLKVVTNAILDNIVRYATERSEMKENGGISGFLALQLQGRDVNVFSGNCIENHKISTLTEKLNFVNQISLIESQKLIEQLEKELNVSEIRKPDLNLLKLMQKSKGQIAYTFYPIQKNTSMFVLNAQVSEN